MRIAPSKGNLSSTSISMHGVCKFLTKHIGYCNQLSITASVLFAVLETLRDNATAQPHWAFADETPVESDLNKPAPNSGGLQRMNG